MPDSNLRGFEEFQNGETPEGVVFSEQGTLKQVTFPPSVWERARKIFGEETSAKTIFQFLKSDTASNVKTIGD